MQPVYDQPGQAGPSFAQALQQSMYSTHRAQAQFARSSTISSPFLQQVMV